ncbi:hypothetical protein GV828_06120 [Flavobacterium sp. NST-5]|uniref:Lipoprotein n=1 Tax=Flavobacterium ichthyis TaxID=2698827 RepID=A0ABW9Z9J3_9FLAO|nr:hypothetical protein [Flavobacterium ichthyis]NBL64775.1 hypothetical protein [Flavobacterium ichthyis]
MKKVAFAVLSCLSLISCKTTKIKLDREVNYIPYYVKVYEADSLYLEGDYAKSYIILDSLFKKFKPINREVYSEYEAYIATSVATNNTKNVKDLVRTSFEKYGSRVIDFEADSLLMESIRLSGWNSSDLKLFSEKYRKKIKIDIRKQVAEIMRRDQEVRLIEHIDIEKLREVDNVNDFTLRNIIKKYGFPHKGVIGGSGFDENYVNLGGFFKHVADSSFFNFYLPILTDLSKKGKCEPSLFTGRVDRKLINEKKKQLYGSYRDDDYKLMPLIDEKKVDSVRKSVGLDSVD